MAKQEFIEEDALEEEEEKEDRGDLLEEDQEEDQEEDEEVEEEEEVDEEEEEELPPKKEAKIPRERFNEVIQQREDAKERNLWLEAQLEKLINAGNKEKEAIAPKEPESTYDFEKAEEDYINLIIEGEIAKATKLRGEINRESKAETLRMIKAIEESVTHKAKTDSSAAFEQDRFDKYIDDVESKYPFLNSNHKAYNEEAVETVNTLLAGYVAAGRTKTEGLKLAVSKVAPFYSKEEVETKQSLGNKRTVAAGKKAASAASSQPSKVKPSTSAKAVDNSDVDVTKISEKDFAKLTAKERSILRGD
jgi:hypothetical protein